ncbi:hypothetical protein NQ034_16080, partial [Brevibacterium sp. 68QC2CO]|nr:hypothetical protein [Brevibacterium sp. 68QC2CO]
TDFLTWLTGTTRQGGTTESGRTFRHRVAWCWNVRPTITPTGEIHDQIMLDGTYFNGWCVLIAHTGGHVIDWQWCDQEKTASWTALIERIPAPVAAIVDGNGPLTSTIKRLWPATRIQRCHFHIRQAAHKHLTRRPSLPANKELSSPGFCRGSFSWFPKRPWTPSRTGRSIQNGPRQAAGSQSPN